MGEGRLWLANFASESVKTAASAVTISTEAAAVEGGFVLDGVKSFGCSTGVADEYLVTAKLRGSTTAEGLCLFFVGRDAAGVSERARWDAVWMLGTATHGIVLKEVYVPSTDALAIPGAFVRMMQRSRGSFVGNHVGNIKVSRASVFADGRTTYTMDTDAHMTGPLRARFEAKDFAFGVKDSDQDRVYMGPDFFGAGQPWGALVDAHYHSPAWAADLLTMVHILLDGKTQAYSSLLYEGPTLVAVFNGLYKNAIDYGTNAPTTASIDSFLANERKVGPSPHVLPFKHAGTWTVELTAYGPRQQPAGQASVRISYRPITLLRAKVDVSVNGPFKRDFTYERTRQGNRHTFDGPDVWGNAIGYGRALYTSQHLHGDAICLKGREFLLDDKFTLSVVWQVWAGAELRHVLFGVLRWEQGEQVLAARYV